MDLGIIPMIAVAVGIVAAAIWLAIRARRTRSLPGDPQAAYHGDHTNAEAAARAYGVDSARDGGGAF
ncbi:hypothetical protein [Agromyces lapidis]|uniref:Uncharacterized protein n=1 Tax=Agromyces lapidis TaxID=279574 RepID=A0ABV5SM72_9MICO|nr:hypothetical protein [Agromyces lapidis]